MDKPKYTARIENIYFLERVGETLRWATQAIADEELPAKATRDLAAGDVLRIETPGGGGFGSLRVDAIDRK